MPSFILSFPSPPSTWPVDPTRKKVLTVSGNIFLPAHLPPDTATRQCDVRSPCYLSSTRLYILSSPPIVCTWDSCWSIPWHSCLVPRWVLNALIVVSYIITFWFRAACHEDNDEGYSYCTVHPQSNVTKWQATLPVPAGLFSNCLAWWWKTGFSFFTPVDISCIQSNMTPRPKPTQQMRLCPITHRLLDQCLAEWSQVALRI